MYRHVLLFPSSFEKDHIDIASSLSTPPGLLARLFILAVKYRIIPLQNDIIDAFLIWLDDFSLHHRIPASVIQYVWSNTCSEDCLLRQFLVAYVHAEYTCWDLKTVKDVVVDKDFWFALSRELVVTLDVARNYLDEDEAMRDLRELLEDDLTVDVCARWHRHGEEEEQCDVLKTYVLDNK
jgi:hypothetical protein